MEDLFCMCGDEGDWKIFRGDDHGNWQLLPQPPLVQSPHILGCNSKLLLLSSGSGEVYSLDATGDAMWEQKRSMLPKKLEALCDRSSNKVYAFPTVVHLEDDEDDEVDKVEGFYFLNCPQVYSTEGDSWEQLPSHGCPAGIIFNIFLNEGHVYVRYDSDKFGALDLKSMVWYKLEDRFGPYIDKEGFYFDTSGTYALREWIVHKYDYESDTMVPMDCSGVFIRDGVVTSTQPTEEGPVDSKIFLVKSEDGRSRYLFVVFLSYEVRELECWKARINFENDCVLSWERILLPPKCKEVNHLQGGQAGDAGYLFDGISVI